MFRLAMVALGAFAISQTPAAQSVGDDVRDFRERQYVTGQRIGCEIRLAMAATDMDVEGVRVLSDQCAELKRKHARL